MDSTITGLMTTAVTLLDLDLLGLSRAHVYIGKGQTFTHLNFFASKISVKG